LFIHVALETAHNEMQCDETMNHMVTARQHYFRTSAKRVLDCMQNHDNCRQKTVVALKCSTDQTVRQIK